MLTREAWNALLKILEEPPPRVVFVFATTDPQKIVQLAAPVLSRVQRFDLKRIGAGEIRARVSHILDAEGLSAEPEALAAIARAADGSMRDALSLTDQVLAMGDGNVTADRVRDALGLVAEDEFIAILDLIADRRAADVFPAVARLAEAGVDFGGFLTGLADILRAQLAIVLGGTASDVSERAREALDARKQRFAAADLLRMLQAVGELEPRFRKSGQQQLLIETLLVRFALLDHSVDIEALLRTMGSSASGGGGGSTVPFARPEPRLAPRAEVSGHRAEPSIGRPSVSAFAPSPAAPTNAAPRPQSLSPARPSPVAGAVTLDLNKLTGRWDALVERLKGDGKMNLASALAHASPVAVTAAGVVTIELDEPNDFFAHSINTGKQEIVTVLSTWFAGIDRLELRRDDREPSGPPKRLTDEMVRAERLASLKKRDPVLGAAIDALDLDVID
jgi:DNA polymerase-3 subunit gamma/tau